MDFDFCPHLSIIFSNVPIAVMRHRKVFRVFYFLWGFMPRRNIIGNLCSKISSGKIQVFCLDFGKLNGRSLVRIVPQNHDRTYL
jgi:hypothetical protein